MWIRKRANADYYYSHYDSKTDFPIYTKNIAQAKTYPTKAKAKTAAMFGDIVVKKDNHKVG